LAFFNRAIEQINDRELEKAVSTCSVYARVAPEHKVRIVKAWQQQHAVVAMTGDGVNDAPALKQADIGAAMGQGGTEVAKGAADMILTDDNFATIVAAVEEGRRIYDNILKAIQFLLSCNMGELFLILVASLLNLGTPLLPVHILWVNLVTDSLPALALSMDPADKDIMRRKPRKMGKGLLDRITVRRILYQGALIGTMPLIAFWMGLNKGGLAMGQTMAFACLIFTQLVHVQNLHSPTLQALATNPLKNKILPLATLLSGGLAMALLLLPGLRKAFNLVPLEGTQWLWVVGLSFIPLIVVDVMKSLKWN
jgi:Ca2+-transporting ATPase